MSEATVMIVAEISYSDELDYAQCILDVHESVGQHCVIKEFSVVKNEEPKEGEER